MSELKCYCGNDLFIPVSKYEEKGFLKLPLTKPYGGVVACLYCHLVYAFDKEKNDWRQL